MAHYNLHNSSLTLLTDLYQLTMAYGFWKSNMQDKEAVFHLFFRHLPFKGGYAITAGLEAAIEFLQHFHFEQDDLDYLATLKTGNETPLFSEEFLHYLSSLELSLNVDAIPEGNVVFPQEPLIRVQGPLLQCQLLESPLLNLVNFPSLIATKASRICLAAQGEDVLEFGLRRAQGIDGALTASRSSFIGGCTSTSNVLAGKTFNIPVSGTHAHSWVLVFPSEQESFEAYAEALPDNCVLLVDTFGTLEGVAHAIAVGKQLRAREKKLLGIRLDSGDLAELSIQSRNLLDEAGFHDTKIVASNELDETIIRDLKRQGAQITVWGVGTNLVTAKDHPALDGVYKLSAIRDPGEAWEYKLKLSEQMGKISNPGVLQVRRFQRGGRYCADMIYDCAQKAAPTPRLVNPLDSTRQKILSDDCSYTDLLIPIFEKGKLIYSLPSLQEIKETVKRELALFPDNIKRFLYPHEYPVGLENSLYEHKTNLIKGIRERESSLSHRYSKEHP